MILESPEGARTDLSEVSQRRSRADLQTIMWSANASVSLGNQIAQPLLERLCEQIKNTVTGLVLLKQGDEAFAVVARRPIVVADQVYLQRVAERAIGARSTIVFRSPRVSNAETRAGMIVAAPMISGSHCFGALVLLLADSSPAAEAEARRCLEIALGWFQAAFIAAERTREQATLDQARAALRALAITEEHQEVNAAAMQLTAHLEAHFCCERVSVGVADAKGCIKIIALSHSTWFDQKSDEVRRLRGAMEECFDQDTTVAVPDVDDAPNALSLAHRALGDGRAYLSVVLRSRVSRFGVITLERPLDRPFELKEIAACEMIASLLAPALEVKHQQHRWISGRIVNSIIAGISALFGPRRPALKLFSIIGAIAVVVLMVATAQHRVPAKAVVEGTVQRAASAPFDGFISAAEIRAGHIVNRGDVLATLDDRDLRLERARWLGEREQRLKQYNEALAKHDRANAGIIAAQVAQAESQLALAEDNLARTRVIAPIDGIVVSGDLSQLIGSPVEKGKVLFEVAPLESYRVVLKVDERDITHVQEGQTGELAITGVVGRRVPFRVQNLTSVTETDEGRNLFRVEAELLDNSPQIRPGMEGVGKIEIRERNLLWIWTHSFFDWLRLKIWTLLP